MTLAWLTTKYWFLSMAKKVKTYVQQCDTCQRIKVGNTKTRDLLKLALNIYGLKFDIQFYG